jgi:hypothetical protein
MRLCATREEALEFVRVLDPADVIAEARDVFGATVIPFGGHVALVEFRDGGPLAGELVRDFPYPPELKRRLDELSPPE